MTLLLWLALAQHHDLIHLSDSHVTRFAGVHPDLAQARASNAETLPTLERFIEAVNALPAATLVHTGDIVDATCWDAANGGKPIHGQVDAVKQAFSRLKHPFHLALGNHDVECYRRNPANPAAPTGDQSVAAQARKEWKKAFHRRAYYSTPLPQGYRLVLLDNGESLDTKTGRAYFTRQMQWFGRELAKHPRHRVIVAFHIPLAADERSKLMLEQLARQKNVVLLLCGHRHTDDLSPVALTDGRQLPQLRTAALFKGANTWRRIRLYPDRLEISATGEPDRLLRSLPLP